jgi:hypothetical protein
MKYKAMLLSLFFFSRHFADMNLPPKKTRNRRPYLVPVSASSFRGLPNILPAVYVSTPVPANDRRLFRCVRHLSQIRLHIHPAGSTLITAVGRTGEWEGKVEVIKARRNLARRRLHSSPTTARLYRHTGTLMAKR